MHMCCAPCSAYPADVLRGEGIDLQGFFYNPNIHPIDEYARRRETVEEFSELTGMAVHYIDGFMQDKWEGYKGTGEQRCAMCYGIRMDRAAEFAKANGFDAFTTSLLVSPYQKHDIIRQFGEESALRHGVEFYYKDFRPGFRQGQQRAKEMGLYRQKFCGCIVSFNERESAQQKKR
ncbi:hypothetical protein DFR58_10748 [Anaerobacterium chartisolvens]|uniref:Epoxyqueuosine reductase QueH n=2 Tax=Anaerobacterium chartisolvens TaxID=1297424 RepID=A0A369B7K8_9FIRM|nr:hypothetical protein DFR58_10748 [Anaerobacterium chartisolvens]